MIWTFDFGARSKSVGGERKIMSYERFMQVIGEDTANVRIYSEERGRDADNVRIRGFYRANRTSQIRFETLVSEDELRALTGGRK